MIRLVAVAMVLAGCGSAEEPEGPTATERGDVDAILRALTADEAISILEEADGFVADDLPARAGEMLESGALPAMRRHLEQMEGIEVGTDLGRRLRGDAVEKLRTRITTTRAYARILARGLVEDLAFVEASAAQRQADEAILALTDELQLIRHPERAEERDEEEEPALGDDEFEELDDGPDERRRRPR